MVSVRITEDNPALETLRRSWATAIYSDEDGLGPMGSLHEAGDALVALALMEESGPTVMGSGVMIGPGLVLVATHVLEECAARNVDPILLTFLPIGARAWLPRESSTVSGPSVFYGDHKVRSDVSLLSCTLNSDAYDHYPLALAPLQLALPLVGERLWAFGYRHHFLEDEVAQVAPLVTSGLVTAVFPQGRGERMRSACIEVAMDTKGGMSGGPVVNANGDLVGIVSSSFDGGPSYVTLIWEALRMRIASKLPSLTRRGDIDLFAARNLGLVKLKGKARRSKRGDVSITLTSPEFELLMVSSDAAAITLMPPGTKPIAGEQLDSFYERWLPEIETTAADTALAHLGELELSLVRRFLSASSVPEACLAPIREFTVRDFEGLDDPDIQSARENEDGTVTVVFAFDLLTVVWTVRVPTTDYFALAEIYDDNFINTTVDGAVASMEIYQRLHFQAALTLNRKASEFTHTSITFTGVVRPKQRAQRSVLGT